MLPDLADEDCLLIRTRSDIVGRRMKDQQLKDAQMELHNVIREDIFSFVKRKFGAVS